MHIPDRFRELLQLEFDGRFRIRWSDHQQLFLVEEKIQRGDPLGAGRPKGWMERMSGIAPDRVAQVRDGYALICQLSPSPRRRCRGCNRTLTLAVNEMRSTKCVCGKELLVPYWPLGDRLLEHLRSIDVDRGYRTAQLREMDHMDATRLQRVRKQSRGISREMHKDDFTQLFGLPMSGSSGKTPAAAWTDAPASPHLRQEAAPS